MRRAGHALKIERKSFGVQRRIKAACVAVRISGFLSFLFFYGARACETVRKGQQSVRDPSERFDPRIPRIPQMGTKMV